MEKKKKIVAITVAAVAVILIVVGVAAAMMTGEKEYAQKVNLGNRYLEAGDYNNAILAFQEAISVNPELEDAYVGLYNTYVRAGRLQYAREVLESGVSRTSSERLRAALEELLAAQTVAVPNVEPNSVEKTADVEVAKAQTSDPILNEQMLSFFCGANFSDYVSNYGSASSSQSGSQYNIRVGSLPATLIYQDTNSEVVIDKTRGTPYGPYQPDEIHMDNVTALFGGADLTVSQLKNLDGVSNFEMKGNTVTFSYENCSVSILCDESEWVTAESENTIVITPQEMVNQTHTLQAQIADAVNGSGVSNAKVMAYKGYGTYGQMVEGTTDSSGEVTLELGESGNYTVIVEKEGYIQESFSLYVTSGDTTIQKSFYLSPTMSQDTIRIVLTWDASPRDLDSYLIGTDSEGHSVRVYFNDMWATNSGGQTVAQLDVDDMDGYGPETVTLYDTAGSYEFGVADYTGSGTMSYSNATVKIYVGDSLYTTVNVTSGLENGWSVCMLDNGEITVTNTTHSTVSGRLK